MPARPLALRPITITPTLSRCGLRGCASAGMAMGTDWVAGRELAETWVEWMDPRELGTDLVAGRAVAEWVTVVGVGGGLGEPSEAMPSSASWRLLLLAILRSFFSTEATPSSAMLVSQPYMRAAPRGFSNVGGGANAMQTRQQRYWSRNIIALDRCKVLKTL